MTFPKNQRAADREQTVRDMLVVAEAAIHLYASGDLKGWLEHNPETAPVVERWQELINDMSDTMLDTLQAEALTVVRHGFYKPKEAQS